MEKENQNSEKSITLGNPEKAINVLIPFTEIDEKENLREEGEKPSKEKGKLLGEIHVQIWANDRPTANFTGNITGNLLKRVLHSLKRSYKGWQKTNRDENIKNSNVEKEGEEE